MKLTDFIGVVNGTSLVVQILFGMIAGLLLALFAPNWALNVALLGDLFITALKSVAPILVFILVTSAISGYNSQYPTRVRPVIMLYLFGTFGAALVAVSASLLFPSTIVLEQSINTVIAPPSNVSEVLKNLALSMVDNPIHALANANFIGILMWAIGLGIALRQASDTTRQVMNDLADSIAWIIKIVIHLAPIGIFGLVAYTVASTGIEVIYGYAHLLAVLIGAMLMVALVVNPLIVGLVMRQNPYPLVLQCLRDSGITAFFTRSSAANIPVNMELCERLKVDYATYSITIPLGATINMAGAAVTINVLTLAAVHTLGIQVDFSTALLLSVLSSICACGASGVAGGSLLLIPLACSLFGIDADTSMQVVAIGFVIGVLQDSTETALNSSTDVLFTTAVDRASRA